MEDQNEPWGVYALYPLRIGLAAVFLMYGWDKLTHIDMVQAMFATWGMPVPDVTAPLVGVVELTAGLALLLGVFVRLAAGGLFVIVATAMVSVRWGTQTFVGGWAFELSLLAALFTLIVNGAGRPTLASVLGDARWDPEVRALDRWRESRAAASSK